MNKVRIPPEQHTYPFVERAIRRKCPDLGLVFNSQRKYWLIVQEVPHFVPIFPCLVGVKGVNSRYTNVIPVLDLWSKELGAVSPPAYLDRILWALSEMEVDPALGLDGFLDRLDKNREDEQKKILAREHARAMYIAKDVARKRGSIISTPHGTINIDKMYARSAPRIGADGKKVWVDA